MYFVTTVLIFAFENYSFQFKSSFFSIILINTHYEAKLFIQRQEFFSSRFMRRKIKAKRYSEKKADEKAKFQIYNENYIKSFLLVFNIIFLNFALKKFTMSQLYSEDQIQRQFDQNFDGFNPFPFEHQLRRLPPQINEDFDWEEKLFFKLLCVPNPLKYDRDISQSLMCNQDQKTNSNRKPQEQNNQVQLELTKNCIKQDLPPTPSFIPSKTNEKDRNEISFFILEQSLIPQTKSIKCNCKKTKCLKLYCQCFKSGEFCGEGCECIDCQNVPTNAKKLKQRKEQIIAKDETAFLEKIKYNGCRCTKSQCMKNYCDCFARGVGCGKYCECIDCLNGKTQNKKDKKRGKNRRRF